MAKSQLTLVQREDAVHVYWHEQHGYFLSDWQPVFKKGADLKRAYQACIDAARTRRGAPWLADASKFVVIDPGDLAWIEDWFWPEFVKAGVRLQAVVSAQREVGKLSTQGAAKGIWKSGIEVSVHETREQAEAAVIAWLDKRKNR